MASKKANSRGESNTGDEDKDGEVACQRGTSGRDRIDPSSARVPTLHLGHLVPSTQ